MFENAYIRDDVRAFRLREESKFKLYHQKYGLRPIGLCQFDLSAKSLRFILTIMNIIKGDYNEVHYYGELKKCEQCVVVSIPYYFVCYYIFRTVLEDDKLKDLLKETLDEIYPRIQGRLNSSFDFENIKRSKKQQEIDNVQTNDIATIELFFREFDFYYFFNSIELKDDHVEVAISYYTYYSVLFNNSVGLSANVFRQISSVYTLRFAMLLAEADSISMGTDKWKYFLGANFKYQNNNSFVLQVFKVAQKELKEKHKYSFEYTLKKSPDFRNKIISIDVKKVLSSELDINTKQ